MSLSYTLAQKKQLRITLDLEVYDDFHPHQIDWNKVFELEPNETVRAYVEDLEVDW